MIVNLSEKCPSQAHIADDIGGDKRMEYLNGAKEIEISTIY